MNRLAVAASLALSLGAAEGLAHEFWIAPEMYLWPDGEAVQAELHVGDDFVGLPRSYSPQRFERFEILTGEGAVEVAGERGDIPALSAANLPEGLAIIVHQTTADSLTWRDWSDFAAFAEHKGLGDVAAMQDERGLDRERVREDYVRYAKALVAIGHGEGADRPVGLRTELVALANPYTDDLAGALPVQLYLDGEPRATAQVEVFSRSAEGGAAEVSIYRTDSNGIVVLPVERGREYLVNAVTLEAGEDAGEDAPEWRTHWASLTFEVPLPEANR